MSQRGWNIYKNRVNKQWLSLPLTLPSTPGVVVMKTRLHKHRGHGHTAALMVKCF